MKMILLAFFTLFVQIATAGDNFVIVTGTGANEAEAKHNAFIAAIESAVGVLVSSETLIQNGELIQDKIITKSQGFIEKYNLLNTAKLEDNSVRITIKAFVSNAALAKELEIITGTKIDVDGKSAYAKVETSKRMYDATMLEFEQNFDTLFSALLASYKVDITNLSFDYENLDKSVPFQITVKLYIDKDRYSYVIEKFHDYFIALGADCMQINVGNYFPIHNYNQLKFPIVDFKLVLDNVLIITKVINGKYITYQYKFTDKTYQRVMYHFNKIAAPKYGNIRIDFMADNKSMQNFTFANDVLVFYTPYNSISMYMPYLRPSILKISDSKRTMTESIDEALQLNGKISRQSLENLTAVVAEIDGTRKFIK